MTLYEVDEWSLAKATIVHYLIVAVLYIPMALFLGWAESPADILIVEGFQLIAFFLIFYSHKDVFYYLPYEMLKFFWDRAQSGGRKSFRYEELNPAYVLPKKSGYLVPYLEGMKIDLEDRDGVE